MLAVLPLLNPHKQQAPSLALLWLAWLHTALTSGAVVGGCGIPWGYFGRGEAPMGARCNSSFLQSTCGKMRRLLPCPNPGS